MKTTIINTTQHVITNHQESTSMTRSTTVKEKVWRMQKLWKYSKDQQLQHAAYHQSNHAHLYQVIAMNSGTYNDHRSKTGNEIVNNANDGCGLVAHAVQPMCAMLQRIALGQSRLPCAVSRGWIFQHIDKSNKNSHHCQHVSPCLPARTP